MENNSKYANIDTSYCPGFKEIKFNKNDCVYVGYQKGRKLPVCILTGRTCIYKDHTKCNYYKASKKDKTFNQAVEEITTEIKNILVSKRRDYGQGNLKAFGEKGILVRAYDKANRLKNLLWDTEREPSNETIEDTWKDLAGYAILALMMRNGTLYLEVEDE